MTRFHLVLPLAIPTLAGLAYLAAANAPLNMLIINGSALALAAVWVLFGRAPETLTGRRIVTAGLLVMLFLPPVLGPEINDVSRWIPAGPLALHAGAFAIPALVVLAADDDDYAPVILLAAILAAFWQPDAASGFAIVFACVGLHDAGRDWKVGIACIIGFLASIAMALRGELPPQPFVERVLVDAAEQAPFAAFAMATALAVGLALMFLTIPLDRKARFALGGSLCGFSITAILSNYPSVLIGYGAAPILGYGLALGLGRRETSPIQH